MALHKIEKGLDLPIEGAPVQVIRGERNPMRVAVMADDFPGLKPGMAVAEGDRVRRGELLFEDRKSPGVRHTAPGAGQVVGVNRGPKRVLQSVVIHLSESERAGAPTDEDFEPFTSFAGAAPESLSGDQVRTLLVESGQWAALRTRPYSKVPAADADAAAIFVTAIDTNPLAPVPDVVVEKRREDFDRGLAALAKLTAGPTHLCVHGDSEIPAHTTAPVQVQRFEGPHPAGNAGLHIHFLEPVGRNKTVWTIGYQDVIAIGSLLVTGRLDVERVVTIAGPAVEEPVLTRTRLGASVSDIVGPLDQGDADLRFIAGSVLSGKAAAGEIFGFLGRYHHQVSVLHEGRERVFLGWLTPGFEAFSSLPIYLSRLLPKKLFPFTTTTNGSPRAMVPIGAYENVSPMDLMPTFLLRSLIVGDTEQAEKLGVLELDEEDVALFSFVCPGKTDYGPLLRKNLETIEKEG
jgi:Na+-transporting NADH:ubiquinone oxidoreductase subunit A